ncbi:ATP-binding protein [bacterium]|nr:ATP-binding protein [bacterium]
MATCSLCGDRKYRLEIRDGLSFAAPCSCIEKCTICNGLGFINIEIDGYRYLKKCSCKTKKDRYHYYNLAEIPAKYNNSAFNNFKINDFDRNISETQKYVLSSLNTYIKFFEADSKGLILYGSSGVGKTHLLISTLKSIILDKGFSGLYIDFTQWVKRYKIQLSIKDSFVALEMMSFAQQVSILVVDEFGKNLTDYDISIFEEIFQSRYNQKKPTLIGTNYEFTQNNDGEFIGKVLSSSLYSRLRDFQSFELLKLSGDDYRLG